MTIKKKSSYVMMAVNLENKKLLIVGGGPVAFKRFLQWQFRGATVHIVAPNFCDGFQEQTTEQASDLVFHKRAFKESDLEKVDLVYIATNDEALNEKVETLCHKSGIWCSRSDSSQPDIQSVAMIERGSIQIGVSTGGNAPALVSELKTTIESAIDLEELEDRMMMLQKLKMRLKTEVSDQAQRAQILKCAVGLPLEELKGLLEEDHLLGLINFLPK